MTKNAKKKKEWLDNGFGFPVILINAPVVTVRGVETLNINYKEYAKAVLAALAHKSARLTGNEIRFIRLYFEKTLVEFAQRFGQKSYQAVKKWEDFGNKATAMNWPTEKDIRLFILDELESKPKVFKALYEDLENPKPKSKEPVKLPASQVAA
ncbi:MAG: hypothetical protein R3A45_04930 [Bdellovibrionota bacterium]